MNAKKYQKPKSPFYASWLYLKTQRSPLKNCFSVTGLLSPVNQHFLSHFSFLFSLFYQATHSEITRKTIDLFQSCSGIVPENRFFREETGSNVGGDWEKKGF